MPSQSVFADELEPANTEAEFVSDMARRLDIAERRIEGLEDSLSRSHDLHAQRMPMRGPRTNARELGSRPGDLAGSGDDFARIELELKRTKSRARDTADRIQRHEAAHVVPVDGARDARKAEKSRAKISSRIAQLEKGLDDIQREIRYLR